MNKEIFGDFWRNQRDKVPIRAKIIDVMLSEDREKLALITKSMGAFLFYVPCDCCNDGWLETPLQELKSMIGEILLDIQIVHSEANCSDVGSELKDRLQHTCEWTFFNLKTNKDTYQLRFIGTSNGYYSEEAIVLYLTEQRIKREEKSLFDYLERGRW